MSEMRESSSADMSIERAKRQFCDRAGPGLFPRKDRPDYEPILGCFGVRIDPTTSRADPIKCIIVEDKNIGEVKC
jgi:hypothetical protein